jgi:hypothetical protein
MLFALTRSNLLRQLPHGNGIILRLTEIVIECNSIGTTQVLITISCMVFCLTYKIHCSIGYLSLIDRKQNGKNIFHVFKKSALWRKRRRKKWTKRS